MNDKNKKLDDILGQTNNFDNSEGDNGSVYPISHQDNNYFSRLWSFLHNSIYIGAISLGTAGIVYSGAIKHIGYQNPENNIIKLEDSVLSAYRAVSEQPSLIAKIIETDTVLSTSSDTNIEGKEVQFSFAGNGMADGKYNLKWYIFSEGSSEKFGIQIVDVVGGIFSTTQKINFEDYLNNSLVMWVQVCNLENNCPISYDYPLKRVTPSSVDGSDDDSEPNPDQNDDAQDIGLVHMLVENNAGSISTIINADTGVNLIGPNDFNYSLSDKKAVIYEKLPDGTYTFKKGTNSQDFELNVGDIPNLDMSMVWINCEGIVAPNPKYNGNLYSKIIVYENGKKIWNPSEYSLYRFQKPNISSQELYNKMLEDIKSGQSNFEVEKILLNASTEEEATLEVRTGKFPLVIDETRPYIQTAQVIYVNSDGKDQTYFKVRGMGLSKVDIFDPEGNLVTSLTEADKKQNQDYFSKNIEYIVTDGVYSFEGDGFKTSYFAKNNPINISEDGITVTKDLENSTMTIEGIVNDNQLIQYKLRLIYDEGVYEDMGYQSEATFIIDPNNIEQIKAVRIYVRNQLNPIQSSNYLVTSVLQYNGRLTTAKTQTNNHSSPDSSGGGCFISCLLKFFS